MSSSKNNDRFHWPPLAGEMAALIRAHDWASTPLGATEDWPQALRSTVEMLVVHGFPMVALWGPDLIQIYNDGYRLLMAAKHPAALGQSTAACWPEVWHINEPIYQRVRAGETVTFDDALYPITRHGPLEDAWFTLTYSPLRGDDGAIAGVLVTVFETTEQHLSDKRRNESEALLGIALEGGGMGAWRWDLHNGLIWGDSKFLELWGFPPSKDPHPLTLFTGRMSPQGAAEMDVVVTKAIKAGDEFDGQLEIVSGPTAGRWIRWRGRADTNAPSVLHGTTFDVTEQRRAEEALRRSEEKFRAFVTASSDVVYRMSPDWSEMRQLVGQSFLADTDEPSTGWLDRYIRPEDHVKVRAAIDRAISTKSMFELEHRVVRADSSIGWTHSRAVPILSEDGSIGEWLGSASDITSAREATERLRENERRQAFLLKLSDVLRPLADSAEIQSETTRLLGEHLGVDRCYYFETDFRTGEYVIHRDFKRGNLRSLAGRHPIQQWPQMTVALSRGETLVVHDFAHSPHIPPDERLPTENLDIRAIILIPSVKRGILAACMAAVQAVPREWKSGEVSLVADVAERTWAAVERARAEASLRDSEERFRQFGEASQDVLWIRNAETYQWEYLTPAFEAIYGLHREAALRGDNMVGWLELIVPEDREFAAASMRRVREGEWVTFEYRVRRPVDGKIRWLRNTDFPIKDEQGKVQHIGGIGHDITAMKKVEDRLTAAESRQRALLEGMPQLVWRAVGSGEWTWTSPQWTKYSGQSEEQSHGWGWLDPVHPDDRAIARRSWSSAIDTGGFQVEYRIRNVDTQTYRWFQTRATPVRDERGAIVEWLGTSTEIEALKETESALRDAEEKVRLFVENVQEYALVQTDQEGFITGWNPGAQRLFGYSSDQMLGRDFSTLLTTEDQTKGLFRSELAQGAGGARSEDARWFVRQDGTRFWARWITEPVYDEKGQFRGVAKIMRDETERERAEAFTRHSLAEKEELLKEVHHRVKNNLQVITSLLNLQARQIKEPAVLALFDESRNRVQSIASIHELLYRSDSLATIQLPAYARQIVPDLIRFYGLEKSVDVQISGDDAALELERAVPYGLLLNELVSNACKHAFASVKSGKLAVTFEQREGEIELTVRDNGPGLPAGFDYQRSTSLGLHLVRNLTRQLRGRLNIEVATGTAVHIHFPAVRAV